MARIRNRWFLGAAVCVRLLATHRAEAATLQQLDQSEWWQGVTGLPTYVNLFLYVPDQLAESPPIVVAPHHCQGDGPGTFSEMSGLVSVADRNGFIMIFPEATGQNCWDAGSDRSLQHDGKGDTHAIVQMVRYVLSTYDADPGRVYSVGGSSGGIMTEALLGVYPDVFMAGVSLMGVPCGCWAEEYNDVVGKPSNGTGQWSGPCAGGTVTKSASEWGDLVRSYFPGYAGHRPRLQHWHGTADTVLSYNNVAEDVKEWTNLLELSETPTGTDTPSNGTTRKFWENDCGYTVYETFEQSGVGHSVAFNASQVAAYFGLDVAGGLDPETEACPGAVPGGVPSEGTGGAGGTGNGGAAGAGTAGGTGGAAPSGGVGGDLPTTGGAAGGTTPETGGATPETGGATPETGGSSPATGGATPQTGGSSPGTGGVAPTGGSGAGGAVTGGFATTGGGPSTGGASPTGAGGVGGAAAGGTPGSGGALGGTGTTTAPAAEAEPASDGCGCAQAGRAGGAPRPVQLLVAALGLLVILPRRRRAR